MKNKLLLILLNGKTHVGLVCFLIREHETRQLFATQYRVVTYV